MGDQVLLSWSTLFLALSTIVLEIATIRLWLSGNDSRSALAVRLRDTTASKLSEKKRRMLDDAAKEIIRENARVYAGPALRPPGATRRHIPNRSPGQALLLFGRNV